MFSFVVKYYPRSDLADSTRWRIFVTIQKHSLMLGVIFAGAFVYLVLIILLGVFGREELSIAKNLLKEKFT